jgi:hypothetical protein
MTGVVLLRLNVLQVYFLGIDNPSPGIGTQEAMAYAGALVMFVIGLFIINHWGRKTKLPEPEEDMEPAHA